MPTLDWIGKKAVLNHHREVPYRLLRCDSGLSVGDPDAGDASTSLSTGLPVQGDNRSRFCFPIAQAGKRNFFYDRMTIDEEDIWKEFL